jgi:hypothetical protein
MNLAFDDMVMMVSSRPKGRGLQRDVVYAGGVAEIYFHI